MSVATSLKAGEGGLRPAFQFSGPAASSSGSSRGGAAAAAAAPPAGARELSSLDGLLESLSSQVAKFDTFLDTQPVPGGPGAGVSSSAGRGPGSAGGWQQPQLTPPSAGAKSDALTLSPDDPPGSHGASSARTARAEAEVEGAVEDLGEPRRALPHPAPVSRGGGGASRVPIDDEEEEDAAGAGAGGAGAWANDVGGPASTAASTWSSSWTTSVPPSSTAASSGGRASASPAAAAAAGPARSGAGAAVARAPSGSAAAAAGRSNREGSQGDASESLDGGVLEEVDQHLVRAASFSYDPPDPLRVVVAALWTHPSSVCRPIYCRGASGRLSQSSQPWAPRPRASPATGLQRRRRERCQEATWRTLWTR